MNQFAIYHTVAELVRHPSDNRIGLLLPFELVCQWGESVGYSNLRTSQPHPHGFNNPTAARYGWAELFDQWGLANEFDIRRPFEWLWIPSLKGWGIFNET